MVNKQEQILDYYFPVNRYVLLFFRTQKAVEVRNKYGGCAHDTEIEY
jgi:hypothetical protein